MLDSTYRHSGYAVASGAIEIAELEAVAEDVRGVFVRRAEALGLPIPAASDHDGFSEFLLKFFATDRDSYLAAARQTQYLASVHRLGLCPAIMEMIGEVGLEVPSQSTRPVVHFMADGLRIEGGYHKTPAHQDWRSAQGSLDGVTIWLPIYDVTASDYPLEVVPGSHLRGLLESTDDAFGHRIVDGLVSDDDFEPLPMRRGDVVMFSGFLVHRTGAQGGKRVRIALSYRFNNAADPSYVERNYPMPYVYRPNLRLLRTNFPTTADVNPYFQSTDQGAFSAKTSRSGGATSE